MALLVAQNARILIADPTKAHRLSLIEALSSDGISCVEAADGTRAWSCFRSSKPDLVLSALQLPGLSGLDLLARVREVSNVPFVIQVPLGAIPAAVEAVRNGAADVIPFPCELTDLTRRIKAFISATPSGLACDTKGNVFTGRSSEAVQIRARIDALAGLRIPVLFKGEKGAGRSYAARCLISAASVDPQHLVRIGPPEGSRRLQESPLKIVYLDEIDKFSKVDQAYWLERVRTSERGDPNSPRRVLASTTGDLDSLCRSTEFNADLAHCMLRFVIAVPPLRDRLADIPSLISHISMSIAARMGRRQPEFAASALKLLQSQSWPGNVAQLEGVLEKLVAFSPNSLIGKQSVITVLSESPGCVASLRQVAVQRQRDELVAVLDSTSGNLAEAARRMKMSRGAVIYRAQKFGLLSKRIRINSPRRGSRSVS